LALLSEQQRAELKAARPDAMEYLKRGLPYPQRRAEYQAAPDPTGERAQTLQRQQKAWNAYSRLAGLGRRRLRKAQQGLAPDAASSSSSSSRWPRASRQPPWLPFLSEQERAEYDAAQSDAIEYNNRGLTNPQRRAEYQAAPDPTGERAQTLARQQTAWTAYARLGRLGRSRLRAAQQGRAPWPESAGQLPPAPVKEPPWLHFLKAPERAAFDAARPDAMEYQRQGLTRTQRRAAYEAAPDPTGERARTLQRQQAAWNVYNRLSQMGRRRLKQAQQDLAPGPVSGGRRQRASREPPWLRVLSEQERAEYDAAWPEANEFKKWGLPQRQRQDEYLAEPDPTGERAKTFERMREAHQTYERLRSRARRRQQLGQGPPSPDSAPEVDSGGDVLGEQNNLQLKYSDRYRSVHR
jgi:hypothetical protein